LLIVTHSGHGWSKCSPAEDLEKGQCPHRTRPVPLVCEHHFAYGSGI